MQKSQSPRLACEIARELLDGLDYCVLHGWQGLPYDLPSDLDIALRRSDFFSLLSRIYADSRLQLVQEIQHESTCVYLVIHIEDTEHSEDYLKLDIAFDYRRNGSILISEAELLRNTDERNGYKVSSPEIECRYLIIKKILKSKLDPNQAHRIMELKRILGGKYLAMLDELMGQKNAIEFEEIIRACASGGTDRKNVPRDRFICRLFMKNPFAFIKYQLDEIRRIAGRLSEPNGLCVAFIGTDGVGKSTAIRVLGQKIAPYFRHRKAFHFGFSPFDSGLNKVTDPHGQNPRSTAVSALKALYYYSIYFIGYLKNILPSRICSGFVALDRCYADLFLDPLRYRMRESSNLVRFLNGILPQPDLVFVMAADTEAVLHRCLELSKNELIALRGEYAAYAAKEPRAQWLYVHEDSERTAHHIHQIILRILAARTARRIAAKYRYAHDHPANPLSTKLFCKNPSVEKRAETVGLSMIRLPLGRKVLVSESNAAARKAVIQSYAPTRLSGRVAKTALANQGVGPLFWRLGTVLGRTDHGIYFSDSVKNIISKIEERIKRRGLVWGAYVGSDGPSQKPLLIGADPSGGQPVIYAKLAWNAVTAAKIIRENEAMNDLAQLREAQFKSPKSAGLLEGGGWQALLIEPLPAPDSTPGVIEAARVFENIASLKRHQTRLADSVMWKMIKGALADFPDGGRGSMLRFIVDKAERRYGGQEYWFSVMHGDFAPWNLKVAGNQPCLYDWENYESEAAVGLDLVHYMIQDELLSRRRTALYAMMSVKSRLHAICTEAIKDRELADYLKMNSTPILVMYAAVEAAKWRSGGCDPESENRVYDLLAAAALELDR